MSQIKVNALVSYSGNTVTLGTSGDTINVASGVTFNTASGTLTLPTTIKVNTIQNTNSTNLITQTNVTTITFGATSQTISVPSVASFNSTIGVGGATPSTSGAGITFPSTASASTDANTLDDYEEGTWTPAFTSLTTNSGTPTFSGTYTKIGRIVHLTWIIAGTRNITITADSTRINNLPFTSVLNEVGLFTKTSALNLLAGTVTATNNAYSLTTVTTSENITGNMVYST
jgi:hypothetical protein